jgi:hypothetical protein
MIIDAGFLVQLDDARNAVTYDRMVPPASFADYRRWLASQVDIINHAIEGLPADRIRYHVCWGSWPGPHVSDVPLKDIVLSRFRRYPRRRGSTHGATTAFAGEGIGGRQDLRRRRLLGAWRQRNMGVTKQGIAPLDVEIGRQALPTLSR